MKNEPITPYKSWFKILLAGGLVTLAGCTKNLSEQDATDTPNSIVVNVSLEGRSIDNRSRAIGISDIDLTASGFSALGYRTDGKFANEVVMASPSLLPSVPQKVAVATDGKFKIPLPQTQPTIGSTISFFAWAGTPVTNTVVSSASKGWPWLEASVSQDIPNQADLVASAAIDVNNEYIVSAVDMNFRHILSKISFKAKSANGANIQVVSAQMNTPASTIYGKAKFTFDGSDSLGVWGNRSTYYTANTTNINRETPPTLSGDAASEIGEVMFIPQPIANNKLKLILKYKIVSGSAQSQVITREVSLKAINLRQNYNYVYTLNVGTEKIELSDPHIADWIESGEEALPIITGPRGDVQLLLDGREQPYVHSDGYTYWLDRSGWNRHVRLNTNSSGQGYVSYDGIKKCYKFNGQCQSSPYDSYGGVIPALGNGEAMVMDIVCEGDIVTGKSWQCPIYLSQTGGYPIADNNRQFWCHFADSETSNCFVDKNGHTVSATRLRVSYSSNYNAHQKTHWTAINTTSRLALYRNGVKGGQLNAPNYKLGSLAVNHLAPAYVGNIYYLELTRKDKTDEEIKEEYTSLAKDFKIPTVSVYEPPVRNNLGLNLNGFVEPQKNGNSTCWYDISPALNHANILKNVTRNGYGYLFNKGVMQLTKSIDNSIGSADATNFTVEVVMRPTKATGFTIYRAWDGVVGSAKYESIYMHRDGTWYNTSEYGDGRYQGTCNSAPVTLGEVQTFTFTVIMGNPVETRKSFYKNGVFVSSIANAGRLGGKSPTYIGANSEKDEKDEKDLNYFDGIIYELRIHKRGLSATEVKENYNWDKARYEIK